MSPTPANETVEYWLAREPSAETYLSLLRLAEYLGGSGSLVSRTIKSIAPGGEDFADHLDDLGCEKQAVSEWPGTKLLGGDTATLRRFPCDLAHLEALREATTALFGWLSPDLPEDLCLYRSDGTVWLSTISHERDAVLTVTASELARLGLEEPGLLVAAIPEHDR
ncbi:MAG: hypothetical protein QM648_12250 [Solirubrobacterales bacterium]